MRPPSPHVSLGTLAPCSPACASRPAPGTCSCWGGASSTGAALRTAAPAAMPPPRRPLSAARSLAPRGRGRVSGSTRCGGGGAPCPASAGGELCLRRPLPGSCGSARRPPPGAPPLRPAPARPRPRRPQRRGLRILLPVTAQESLWGSFPLQSRTCRPPCASCAWLLPAVLSQAAGPESRSEVRWEDMWGVPRVRNGEERGSEGSFSLGSFLQKPLSEDGSSGGCPKLGH